MKKTLRILCFIMLSPLLALMWLWGFLVFPLMGLQTRDDIDRE